MNINEARYIVRMIEAYRHNILFLDATDEDAKELDRMKERYHEAGRWQAGREAALAEFIMRVAENGVPGGKSLMNEGEHKMAMAREVPIIERPKWTLVNERMKR